MFETLRQDVRHGARMLMRDPGFALVAILSIGVGVAACATIFSVADGFVTRPLPVPRAGEILTISATTPADRGNGTPLSHPDFMDLRAGVRSFSGVSGHRLLITSFARQREDQAISRLGFAVSANFFDVMEIRPHLGRFFVAEEDRVPGRDAVAVISYETWTQLFGSDPGVVGRSVRLGGQPYTVIGVTPERFTGPELVLPGGFYVPLAMTPAFLPPGTPNLLDQRDVRMITVKARLRDGVSVAQAREEVAGIGLTLQQRYPRPNARQAFITRTHLQTRAVERGPATYLVAMLLTLALVVLAVACANVAGLLTSRAPSRARELAVRLAIGAGRGRIVRQLITESLLIAAAGAALGIGLGVAGVRLLQQRQIVSDIGVRLTLAVDERVIGFSILAAALSTFVAGLVPALRAARQGNLSNTLRVSTTDQGRSRLWGRQVLVAGQVALSLALVTVAVFLYRTMSNELERGPGFRTSNLLLVSINPSLAGYDPTRTNAAFELVSRRVAGLPGVTSVGFASAIPMNQDYRDALMLVPEGFRLPPGVDVLRIQASRIDEGYLDTMGIRLIAGRGIRSSDTAAAPMVMVVNKTMADHFWPGESPLGKRVRARGDAWAEVVGVVADSKYNFVTESATDFAYVSRAQDPAIRGTLVVAASGSAAALAAPVRDVIASLDRELPITSIRTMEEYFAANAQGLSQMLTRTVGTMGTVGVGLAMVGLYGLIAYMVSRRAREIGVRMALGAQPGAVLAMVLKRGLTLTGIGAVAGIAITFGVSGLLRSMFPSTQGIDGATYATVVPGLLVVTTLAALIPARRASRIDPLVALRED